MRRTAVIFMIISFVLSFAVLSCKWLGEGDPVEAKKGIIGKWQSDASPGITMDFINESTGNYKNNDKSIDLNFKYKFIDGDTIETTFPNGNKMNMDVKTTTMYLWLTNQDGTDRMHKM